MPASRYDILQGREDQESGKTYWTRLGVAFPRRDKPGMMLKFNALPISDRNGEVNVLVTPYQPKEDSGGQQRRPAQRSEPAEIDDEIPW